VVRCIEGDTPSASTHFPPPPDDNASSFSLDPARQRATVVGEAHWHVVDDEDEDMWGQVRAGGEAGFTTCDKLSLQLLLSSDASSAIVIASRCTSRHNCDASQRSTTHLLLCLRRSTTHLFLCAAPPPAHLTFSPPCLGFMSRDLPSPRLPPLNNHTQPHNCLHSIATCGHPTAFRWCLFLSRLSVVAPPLALIRCVSGF
jgi:hypothetical protein